MKDLSENILPILIPFLAFWAGIYLERWLNRRRPTRRVHLDHVIDPHELMDDPPPDDDHQQLFNN